MMFDPIYWVPILAISVIMLIGIVSGFLSRRMEKSVSKASLFSGVAAILFFTVHVSIATLIPVFSPWSPSEFVANWLVLSAYLSLLLMIYFLSDRWLVKPTERSIKNLEERLDRQDEWWRWLGDWYSSHEDDIEELHEHAESMRCQLEDLSKAVRSSKGSRELRKEVAEKIEEVKNSMKGSVSRVEGIEFQEWSAQLFRNLGFDVKNQVHSKSDHVLRVGDGVKGIVSAKNWTLEDRNRTVNESRLGIELEKAREFGVPLIVHVRNKETDRNWFHVFEPGEFDDPKRTTPDWLREEDLTEDQKEKMRKNYRKFHGFVDGLITG